MTTHETVRTHELTQEQRTQFRDGVEDLMPVMELDTDQVTEWQDPRTGEYSDLPEELKHNVAARSATIPLKDGRKVHVAVVYEASKTADQPVDTTQPERWIVSEHAIDTSEGLDEETIVEFNVSSEELRTSYEELVADGTLDAEDIPCLSSSVEWREGWDHFEDTPSFDFNKAMELLKEARTAVALTDLEAHITTGVALPAQSLRTLVGTDEQATALLDGLRAIPIVDNGPMERRNKLDKLAALLRNETQGSTEDDSAADLTRLPKHQKDGLRELLKAEAESNAGMLALRDIRFKP